MSGYPSGLGTCEMSDAYFMVSLFWPHGNVVKLTASNSTHRNLDSRRRVSMLFSMCYLLQNIRLTKLDSFLAPRMMSVAPKDCSKQPTLQQTKWSSSLYDSCNTLTRLIANVFSKVSFNYRLGMFGWLGGPKYADEYGTINLGLEDQKAAIEWVANEVYRFGGSNQL